MHHGPFWSDKSIGAYGTGQAAAQAIARARRLPGFDRPEGVFYIYRCALDCDYWPGGIDKAAASINLAGISDVGAGTAIDLGAVFFLSNVSEVDIDAAEYIIGFYSSELSAQQAMERLRQDRELGGPDRKFIADRYVVNDDHWRSGFNTGYEGMK